MNEYERLSTLRTSVVKGSFVCTQNHPAIHRQSTDEIKAFVEKWKIDYQKALLEVENLTAINAMMDVQHVEEVR